MTSAIHSLSRKRVLAAAALVAAVSSACLPSASANPFRILQPREAVQETRVVAAYHRPEPVFVLPYSGWQYPRNDQGSRRGFLFGEPRPSSEMLQLITVLRTRAEEVSRLGLSYRFGGDHPSKGGMDCSGTMKYLISDIGFRDMPRTSYQQYEWLRQHRTLQHSKSIPERMGGRRGIKPGDLIFWGGTYDSGHKVSHVMLYLGQNDDGTHYMFGARGRNRTGMHGSGVDIFTLASGYQRRLVGYGTLPGVR